MQNHTHASIAPQVLSSITSDITAQTNNPQITQITQRIGKFPEYIPSSYFDRVETSLAWSHFSLTRRIWEYFIFITSVIIPIEISFVLLFDDHISASSYSVFFVFDIFQFIDNFVIIFTPFIRHGILVSEKREIIMNYGIANYVIHVLGSLPLGWIGVIKENNMLYVLCSILRLLRLHQAYKSYVLIRDSTIYNHTISHTLPQFVFMLFIVHVFACIFYACGKFGDDTHSWVTPFVEQGYDNTKMYVVSIYFVLTTVLTLGYGDIHPVSTSEVIVSIFLVLTGVVIQSNIIANMVNALSDPMGSKFLNQYKCMQEYLEFKGVPKIYKDHIKHYFQGQWERNHGAPSWHTLLSRVPKGIQSGIKLEFCQRTFSGMPLFNSVGQKYLLLLMNNMTPFTYLPNDIICTQEDANSDLLIFNHGIIQLILNYVPIASLNVDSGYVDGERQIMFGKLQDKTIKAVTFVDGWRLKRKDFLELISTRRNLRTILLMNARARFPKDFADSPEWDDAQIEVDGVESDSDTETSEMDAKEVVYVEQSTSSSDSQFTDADL